jgi:TonB family protein
MNAKTKNSRLAVLGILLAVLISLVVILFFSGIILGDSSSIIFYISPKVQTSLDNNQKLQQKPVKETIKFTPPVIAKDNIEVLNYKILDTYYPGGHNTWWDFIMNNFRFTKGSRYTMAQGEILVQFKVTEHGEITNPKVIMSLRNDLDREAIRVFSIMPKWKPILKAGKAVNKIYQVPLFIKIDPTVRDFQLSLTPILHVSEDKDKPYIIVDQNPEYKGGYQAMLDFLQAKMKYPIVSKKSGIQGTVFLMFVVEKTGKITKVKILRGIDKSCDEEAMRLVKSMPDWIPGRQDGKVVRIMFQIPVKFQLAMKY